MNSMGKYDFSIDPNVRNGHTVVLSFVERGSRVLEVGCATGYMTRYLSENMGCLVDCIDIDKDALRSASQYAQKTTHADVQYFNFESLTDSYDVVLFADVLEHLKNPEAVLLRCSKCLRHGGRVIASIPNIGHISVVNELAHGSFEYRQLGLLDNTHIHFFTRNTIEKMFRDVGFAIQTIDTVVVAPEDTEFGKLVDKELREFVQMKNTDLSVYQFVINAELGNNKGFQDASGDNPIIDISHEELLVERDRLQTKVGILDRQILDYENVLSERALALSQLADDVAILQMENLYLENENTYLLRRMKELERDLNWLMNRTFVKIRLRIGGRVKRVVKHLLSRR